MRSCNALVPPRRPLGPINPAFQGHNPLAKPNSHPESEALGWHDCHVVEEVQVQTLRENPNRTQNREIDLALMEVFIGTNSVGNYNSHPNRTLNPDLSVSMWLRVLLWENPIRTLNLEVHASMDLGFWASNSSELSLELEALYLASPPLYFPVSTLKSQQHSGFWVRIRLPRRVCIGSGFC